MGITMVLESLSSVHDMQIIIIGKKSQAENEYRAIRVLERKQVPQAVVVNHRSNMDRAYEDATVRHPLQSLKLDQLKQIIRDIQNKCNRRIKISGTKSMLVDRIAESLVHYIATGGTDNVNNILQTMNFYAHSRYRWLFQNNKVCLVPTDRRPTATAYSPMQGGPSVSSRPNVPVTATYKYGPFFEIIDELSPPCLCQSTLHSRSVKSFNFTLNITQQQQINNQTHEVRFFCAKYKNDDTPALMEFPEVCEIRVNGKAVISTQQLRGIKNKPGTINPPDLTKFIRNAAANTVDLVYAHCSSEYVASVFFVQRYTVSSLVQKLVDDKFVAKEKVLEKFAKEQEEADVMIEFQTVSMKCPLAFTRIQTPCRASTCTHAQCFDAYTFLKMNEQTPTWSCPACSRPIGSFNDLLVDGYFRSILDTCESNVESVRIGADGGIQYIKEDPDDLESKESSPDAQIKRESSIGNAETITILDEEEDIEQEPRGVKRSAEDLLAPITSTRPRTNLAVIDLTLSDDEQDETSGELVPHEQPTLVVDSQPRLIILPPTTSTSANTQTS